MTAQLLKAAIKARVRQTHAENVELSKADPVIKPGLTFHEGFKSDYPGVPADFNRKMRRALERQMLKKVIRQQKKEGAPASAPSQQLIHKLSTGEA
jgi:hypothetical protein